MTKQIRIILADDHPLIRSGIRMALQEEEGVLVVAEAVNGVDVRQMCQVYEPDILLLDLNMPGSTATQTVTYLKQHQPQLKILVLTAYDDEAYIRGMTMLGVDGYMLKDEAPDTVVRAVHAIMSGGSWFSRSVLEKLILLQPGSQSNTEKLTEREQELLVLLARGLDNQTIASKLSLAEQTVRNYLSQLYSKLRITSRNEAIVWAIKHGFIANDSE